MRNWRILHWRKNKHCYRCGLRVRHIKPKYQVVHTYPGGFPTLVVSPKMYKYMKEEGLL